MMAPRSSPSADEACAARRRRGPLSSRALVAVDLLASLALAELCQLSSRSVDARAVFRDR